MLEQAKIHFTQLPNGIRSFPQNYSSLSREEANSLNSTLDPQKVTDIIQGLSAPEQLLIKIQ